MKSLFFFLLMVGLFSCTKNNPPVSSLTGKTMGTTYSIKIAGELSSPQLEKLQQKIDQLLIKINQQMSTYIPSSELSLFNKFGKNAEFPISKDIISVLETAREVHHLSQGAYDVTIGNLVNLWGFGPIKKAGLIPTKEEINRLKSKIGDQFLKYDKTKSIISKDHQEIYVDLSSIAKGFAVDKVSDLLIKNHFPSHLVEIGGEVVVKGKKSANEYWIVAIEKPDQLKRGVQKILPLEDMAMATSGSYRNFFEKNGKRYSHTIDPRRGYPITHRLVSVSVLDKTCERADALATAFMVMGPYQGKIMANKEKLAVYFLIKEEKGYIEWQSEQFEKKLQSILKRN